MTPAGVEIVKRPGNSEHLRDSILLSAAGLRQVLLRLFAGSFVSILETCLLREFVAIFVNEEPA